MALLYYYTFLFVWSEGLPGAASLAASGCLTGRQAQSGLWLCLAASQAQSGCLAGAFFALAGLAFCLSCPFAALLVLVIWLALWLPGLPGCHNAVAAAS